MTTRLDAYYTESQAARGKAAFNKNCLYCHGVDPKRSTPADLVFALPSSFAGHFLERIVNDKRVYPSVYVLYSKFQSMPATDTRSITNQNRVDIAAYILQANGYPAGATEIPVDADAMRLMNLNEPGFEPVFNGKDMTGLRFRYGNLNAPPPGQLTIENGVMACACNAHGEWETAKRYKDFVLRFDMRFERPADWSGDDELFSGGSGIYILGRATGNGSIEVEGRHRDFLQLFAIGGKATWTQDLDAKRRVIRPLGEWNSVEIVAKGQTIKVFLNGTLVTTATDHDYTAPGHIRFQSQGAKMLAQHSRPAGVAMHARGMHVAVVKAVAAVRVVAVATALTAVLSATVHAQGFTVPATAPLVYTAMRVVSRQARRLSRAEPRRAACENTGSHLRGHDHRPDAAAVEGHVRRHEDPARGVPVRSHDGHGGVG